MSETSFPAKQSKLSESNQPKDVFKRIVRPLLKFCYQGLERQLSRTVWLRPGLHLAYDWTIRGCSWMRPHPFDTAYGVETGGYVPWWLLGATGQSTESNLGYGGCQPSCLRRALETIPDPSRYIFLDIGCGKGRGLIVASELPFRAIIGVEVDQNLCRTCQDNVVIIRNRFQSRTPIKIVESDARQADFPSEDLVVFIYHAFEVSLLRDIVQRLLADKGSRSFFIIYQNPVFGHVLDAEAGLRRWFAETVPREPAEQNVGSGGSETVVCWVSRSYPGSSCPDAEIAIKAIGSSAVLRE